MFILGLLLIVLPELTVVAIFKNTIYIIFYIKNLKSKPRPNRAVEVAALVGLSFW